jgi:hypothetical protein
MRYSAIQTIRDGRFVAFSPYAKDEALANIADDKLKAFFNKHKYVVVEVEDKDFNGVGVPYLYTYMVFKEEHPMFNISITLFDMSREMYTHPRIQHFKFRSNERDEIYKRVRILREFFEGEVF